MATNADVGLGTVLSYWDATQSAWVEIGEVTSIELDGPTREVIEVSKLNTTDEYINKVQGMLNGGQVTVGLNYVLATYGDLRSQMETRGNYMYQIKLPDLEGLEFDGFISSLPLSIVTDDVMKHDLVFEIDGQADFLTAVS